mmetsp:Transcript_9961/g.14891  ORF Transcript_9961/g.14891 Transcript_9961/m.14891 type:complete len:282 (-) Transcript_9961:34-879(-)
MCKTLNINVSFNRRDILLVKRDIRTTIHTKNSHYFFCITIRTIQIGMLPRWIPQILHHLRGRWLVIDHHSPLCKVEFVQILRPDIGRNIIHDEKFAMQSNFAAGFPRSTFLILQETNAKIIYHLLFHLFLSRLGELFTHSFDDFSSNFFATPSIAVVPSFFSSPRVTEDDLDINSSNKDCPRPSLHVMLRPTLVHDFLAHDCFVYRAKILEQKTNRVLRSIKHGADCIIGGPIVVTSDFCIASKSQHLDFIGTAFIIASSRNNVRVEDWRISRSSLTQQSL